MSDNVFADLGFAHPDDELLKAQIVIRLREAIRRRRLTQAAAADLLGIAQPDVSRLVNGRVLGYSLERMLGFLVALGHDVEIRTKRKPASRPGRITLAA